MINEIIRLIIVDLTESMILRYAVIIKGFVVFFSFLFHRIAHTHNETDISADSCQVVRSVEYKEGNMR